MARFLFVLWLDGGNVNPFARLADELLGVDHEVVVVGPEQLRAVFEPGGASFRACAEWMPSPDEVLAATDATSPDALVVDHMATAALGGAEASGLPTVVLVHTLLDANRVGDDIAPMWMTGPASAANASRTRFGLSSAGSHEDLLAFATTLLVAAPALLEPGPPRDPRTVHAGPLYREPEHTAVKLPDGDEPLVIGCAGTAATDVELEPVLLANMTLAIESAGYRGLITVPPYIDRAHLPDRPGVVSLRHVPHPTVLPKAAAFVTHAGLGSVCAALVAGTPMVCLPLGREQPTNADAVQRVGAGVALPARSDADEIATALRSVIGSTMPTVVVDASVAVDAVERVVRPVV